jgi:hypothetical protein
MRHARLTVALVCALLVGASTPALGAPPVGSRAVVKSPKGKKKPRAARAAVARCVKLDQETGTQTLDVSLTNSCAAALSCSLGWVVRCGSGRRGTTHKGSETFTLGEGLSQTVTASAAECGHESWRIGGIRWSCSRSSE